MQLDTPTTAQQPTPVNAMSAEPAPPWHQMPVEAVYSRMKSSPAGLSADEANLRLDLNGPNELQAASRPSPWSMLLDQFKNVLILILLSAALVSAFLGHAVEAVAIAVIVLFAVLLGFFQEYRAEKAIASLRRMAAPRACVMRDGEEVEIPAREVVPGDVVLLRAGDKIPADARLTEAFNLQVEESPLTGESVPVAKHAQLIEDRETALADRKNMAYAGTVVTYGRGRGVVVATGMQTQFGEIARMLQSIDAGRTPLQENLDRVGRKLAKAALVLVGAIVALGLLRGQPLLEMLVFGIALAVAVVPEALPAVVTISLAIGVQRMVKRHALMRRLAAVETLGSTSTICSDKTGTLTKDEMTVRKIFVDRQMIEVTGAGYAPHGTFLSQGRVVDPSPSLEQLLWAAVLCSDAHIVQDESDGRWHVKGDPTEGALVVAAAKARLHKADLDTRFPRIREIPFTSETKRMTTFHRADDAVVAYAKGAPEIVIAACASILLPDGESLLDNAGRTELLHRARRMADEALRVLAIARKTGTAVENVEHGMTFLGLVGMLDPPRPEAKQAIRICKLAGIRPVMITGDHPLTARAVALDLELLKSGRILTGAQLERMEDGAFERAVENIEVYARVSPAHKLRVVTALQKKNHVVAMTGDGINDAPALKKADIGIAMGMTGTDVTKEAADMTLTDDNFASIVAAVEEGRGIFSNIKKYLMYLLSSNIGEIGLMAGATLMGLPLPLTAVQILYVNLATDGLPALALSVDLPEPDLMKRRPRDPRSGIFTPSVVALILAGGLWSTLVNLGLYIWAVHSGRSHAEAVTMTFVSLILIQFFKAYNFRSDHHSILNRPFANRWLNLAIGWELLLLCIIVYLPPLQHPFGTFSLVPGDWVIVFLLAFTVSPVLEAVKWIERRGWLRTNRTDRPVSHGQASDDCG
jgi:Ca2+-transporting ATPase